MNNSDRSSSCRTWRDAMFRVMAYGTIVLLVSLFVVPACSRVGGPKRISSIRTEISALESAIASFQQRYGVEPPSGVTLHATKEGWDSDRVSRARIRQIWPEFDFETCGGLKNVPEGGVKLNGAECVVFFLGGILQRPEDSDGDGVLDASEDLDGDNVLGAIVKSGETTLRPSCTGFSRSPLNPFALGGSRDTAIYEFDISRLVDTNTNGFPEYLDLLPGQTKPYLYVSSYESEGYDPADLEGALQDIYRKTSEPDAEPWKPKSFQIISPGRDHEYGIGGYYDPQTADSLRNHPRRKAECDNLTNFISGELDATAHPTTSREGQFGPIAGFVLLSLVVLWVIWCIVCRRQ